jgi:DegV family protein with EDD domain
MIKIVADTTCSLPISQMKELQIPVIPQIIIFGDQSYRDDTEIDAITFLKKLRTSSSLPKTAAPPPKLYNPIYEEFGGKGNTIIVITPSAEVSGTFRSAQTAALDFPDSDIRIVDSRTVAGGLGQLVLQANRWAKEGLDADTIVAKTKDLVPRSRVIFVVDTLEYLYKGGRIGGAKALIGSILQIKPILTLKDGRIEPVESQRTRKRAIARLHDLVLAECPPSPEAKLCISHIDAEEDACEMAAFFTKELGIMDIPIYFAPPAIIVHGGPKIIAPSFYMKS